jgi:alpha-tubulin suppressor-like RCC1 family protein
MRLAWILLCCVLSACSNVAEVLSAAGGAAAGAAPSGGLGGGGSSAGSVGVGGDEPDNPALGVVVDSGDSHTCAARFGALYCWGANADGRLGLGDDADRPAPERVGHDADWIAVATGVAHTCALKQDGSVWCFGANNFGQLGQGTPASSSVPLPVTLPGKAALLSSEANTACVVLEDGALYCWGRNFEGNIGLSDQHPGVDQPRPIRSGSANDWSAIGTGDGHTCGVRAPGSLFCWGRNSASNLGLGQTVDVQLRRATRIGSDEDWSSVASGQDGSCALRAAGSLFCWGGNGSGNLGLGDREQRMEPTALAVPSTGAWEAVSVDTFHACAIAGGDLYCWGRNTEGQLGSGDNDDRLEPALIDPGEGDQRGAYRQVAVGRFSSCAVTTDSHIACSGENVSGQLGTGDSVRRNAFTVVPFP